MKVLIQNVVTKRYLSACGRWVGAADDAKDFYALIPAYHFARQHTEGRFTVVLYSPDDNYCMNIIDGEGEGMATAVTVASGVSGRLKMTDVCEPRPAMPVGSVEPDNFTVMCGMQSRFGNVHLN
jgi:hypothetical protein